MIAARELRALRSDVRRAAAALRGLDVDARATAIERACQLLVGAGSPIGRELRSALLASTGLSAASIEHGLTSTLGAFLKIGLLELHARAPRGAGRGGSGSGTSSLGLATVVLAGNVFSAAARPLLLPLLCGVPVLLKAASGDDAFPHALQHALAHVEPTLGAACAVVSFARDDRELVSELLADAELLHVYGDDDSVAALRSIAPAGTRLVAHGHGLGVAFVAESELGSEASARVTAAALARDVAAYDQRGCLSPQAVFVQRGAQCSPQRFAQLLADALDALAVSWPRGRLPADVAAAQLQWRGVAAATGELHVRDSCAVGYAQDLPLRASPGYRNLSVHDIGDLSRLRARIAALSVQLKALGVAGARELTTLADAAPYVCPLGTMQEPPLDATLDGLHPLAEL